MRVRSIWMGIPTRSAIAMLTVALCCCEAWGAGAGATAAPAPATAPAGSTRAPIPSNDAQLAAERLIRDVHKQEFAKTSLADRRALISQLLDEAEHSSDAAERYVLLRDARELAINAGDAAAAMPVVDAMAHDFD